MTSSFGGSTPIASAGAGVRDQIDPENLRREQRQDDGLPSGPVSPITPPSTTPKNTVSTSARLHENR